MDCFSWKRWAVIQACLLLSPPGAEDLHAVVDLQRWKKWQGWPRAGRCEVRGRRPVGAPCGDGQKIIFRQHSSGDVGPLSKYLGEHTLKKYMIVCTVRGGFGKQPPRVVCEVSLVSPLKVSCWGESLGSKIIRSMLWLSGFSPLLLHVGTMRGTLSA